jgi:hypothetical protein
VSLHIELSILGCLFHGGSFRVVYRLEVIATCRDE